MKVIDGQIQVCTSVEIHIELYETKFKLFAYAKTSSISNKINILKHFPIIYEAMCLQQCFYLYCLFYALQVSARANKCIYRASLKKSSGILANASNGPFNGAYTLLWLQV